MHLNDSSPSFSPTSPTLSIGFLTSSSMDSLRSSTTSQPRAMSSASSSSQGSTCAYPSWPSASSLSPGWGRCGASSYISDAELFGLDDSSMDDFSVPQQRPVRPYLSRAPSPPRQYAPVAAYRPAPAPLAPLYSRQPARSSEKKRNKSPRKQSKHAQTMSPISESPETPE